ncbi:hypothetical protein ACSBR2_035523 [Camellia fascicularis]
MRIKELLKEKNVDMVWIQESYRSSISEGFVRSIWPNETLDYMVVDAKGSVGGLLCIWKLEVFTLIDCNCARSFIILSGTIHQTLECVVGNIYAPNEVVDRRKLRDILCKLKNEFPKP